MSHTLVGPKKGRMGEFCSCDKSFPVKAAALKHIDEANKEQEAARMAEQEANKKVAQDKPAKPEVAKTDDKVDAKPPYTHTMGPVPEGELAPGLTFEHKAGPEKAIQTPEGKTELVQTRQPSKGAPSISSYLNNDEVKKIIQRRIGNKPEPFIAAIMTAVNGNEALARCTPQSILGAAIEATGLNLSVAPALGEAYLVPYKDQATLQVGYKGYIQLAQRSGLYKTIAATPVYEGQLIEENPLTGNTYDWNAKKSDKVIGYVAYFKLLNGFESSWYMTGEQVRKHAQKFSQSFRKGFGPWKDHEERMSLKTPLRFLLNTYGPRSIEVDHALQVDQAVIEGEQVEYPDNRPEWVDRVEGAASREDLKQIMSGLSVDEKKEAAPLIEAKMREVA